jgi:hypothetical protein
MFDRPSLAADEHLETMHQAVTAAIPGGAPRYDRGEAQVAKAERAIANR